MLHHTPGVSTPTVGDAVVMVGDRANLIGLDIAIKSRLETGRWGVSVETDDYVDSATDDNMDLIVTNQV